MEETQIEPGFFKGLFPEIETERLLPLTAESRTWGFAPNEGRATYLGIFVVKGDLRGDRRISLTKGIVDAAYGRGVDVYPQLYEQSEWRDLERANEGREWEAMLVPGASAREAIAAAKRQGEFPKRVRETMLDRLRRDTALVHSFLESSPEQRALCVPVLSRVVHETFESLSALLGCRYRGDHRDLEQLGEALSRTGHFEETDVYLTPYLVALAEQTKHLRHQSKGDASRACLDAADAVVGLLERASKFVAKELTDEWSRRRKRVERYVLILVGGVFVVVVALMVWTLSSPASIGAPAEKVGKPGAISVAYFQGTKFDRLVKRDNVTEIGVPKRKSPVEGLKADRYSVRWKGYLNFDKTGTHTVCTKSDDGARLFINDKEVISDWSSHAPKKTCVRIDVDTVGWYPVKLEYFEVGGPGTIELSIGETEETAAPVAASNLCCRGRDKAKGKDGEKGKDRAKGGGRDESPDAGRDGGRSEVSSDGPVGRPDGTADRR
jgi:hypothetical protein